MQLTIGNRITTDGLVFCYDQNNTVKSWKGAPTYNILSNKVFSGWYFQYTNYTNGRLQSTGDTTLQHYTYLDSSLISGNTYTLSVWAKASEHTILQLAPSSGFSDGLYINFNLTNGTMYGNTSAGSMTDMGNGWWRCSYTATATLTILGKIVIAMVATTSSTRLEAFALKTGTGVFLKNPQFEARSFPTPFTSNERGVAVNNIAKNTDGTRTWTPWTPPTMDVTETTILVNERYRYVSTTNPYNIWRAKFPLSLLVNGTTYMFSCRYKVYSGTVTLNDWCDVGLNKTTINEGNGVYFVYGYAARATYNDTYRFIDFNTSSSYDFEIWDIQLEEYKVRFPSTYARKDRDSSENCLIDIKRGHEINTSNMTYTSDGGFQFQIYDAVNRIGNYMRVPTSDDLNFGSSPFSVELVTKRINLSGVSIGTISKGDTTSAGWGDRDGAMFLHTNAGYLSKIPWIAETSWKHYVFLFNPDEAPFIRLFVNGIESGSEVVNNASYIGSVNNSTDLYIGCSYAGGTHRLFNGYIPLVRLYNKALTETEIKINFEFIRWRYGL